MNDDDRLALTPEEEEQIARLTRLRETKYGEIIQELANQYGLGNVNEADPDDPQIVQLKREAEEAADNWDTAEVDAPRLTATTPFQRLLAEHYELGEQILNIQDEAMLRQFGIDDEDEA